VDGTLLEAWAGQKSFRRIDDDQQPPAASGEEGGSNPTVNFHGESRSNDTHSSTTDPDAALLMAEDIPGNGRVTLGADKGYDVHDFVGELRHMNVTPHVAQNDTNRRTTSHDGYRVSQRKRKRIEEVFGWMKTLGLLRKLRHRGLEQVGWVFTFTAPAYNLVRISAHPQSHW